MSDEIKKFLMIGSLRPYVGWSFDSNRLGGPRIGAEGGYFLKIGKDEESEKTENFWGMDILAFGETDPTKPSLWTTGARLRGKDNFGIASIAAGTGVSIRNSDTEKTKTQFGVPFDVQAGLLFDTMFIGGGLTYYPDAGPHKVVGEFKIGTDVFKTIAILRALGWL